MQDLRRAWDTRYGNDGLTFLRWRDKIGSNVRRDKATDIQLKNRGWLISRFWAWFVLLHRVGFSL